MILRLSEVDLMQKLPKKYAHLQSYADENKIGYQTFRARMKRKGWSAEKAAKTPLKKPDPYLLKAKENGISSNVFYTRTKKYNWSKEDASTIPIRKKRKYPKVAMMNDISPFTYFKRLDHGWSEHKAMTTPVRKYGGRQKTVESESDQETPDPYTQYKKVAKEKGIPIAVYNAKIFDEAMTPEEAVK